MSADGPDVHPLTANRADNIGPAWAPDDALIAFAHKQNRTYRMSVMRTDGAEVTPLTTAGGTDPAW